MRKNYILDANILLHDPQSIMQFADNTVLIPVGVLTEIDRFKKERTERGFHARAVVRLLDSLRNGQSLSRGIDLTNGGRLTVYCEPDRLLAIDKDPADWEILRVARAVQEQQPDTPTVIVSKDINLRIRADAIGLRAEDYETDQVRISEIYSGQHEIDVSADALHTFLDEGALTLDGKPMMANEYVLLRCPETQPTSALARVGEDGLTLHPLHQMPDGVWGIKPRNKEQYFAIDALLNPDISLVTLMGKAGTGKTLLALAAAMHLTIKARNFRGVLVGRPIFPLGRDIGFLPGDVGQKLEPWMKPIADTIDYLIDSGGPVKGQRDSDTLIRAGLIEVQPLTYIRGRSIANRMVVIDEAQNLSPLEVKTIITRLGRASKVVLTGDPYQIDNPYVDVNSNGFTYLVNRFRDQPLAAHVELRKGERSPLAELAANLL